MFAGQAQPRAADRPPDVAGAPRQQPLFLGPAGPRSQTESVLDASRTPCECLVQSPIYLLVFLISRFPRQEPFTVQLLDCPEGSTSGLASFCAATSQ